MILTQDLDESNSNSIVDDEEVVSVKYYERNNVAYKIVCIPPFDHWEIRRASGGQKVNVFSGTYTSLSEAKKAIDRLPEDLLPKSAARKKVLTPKVKVELDEELDG